MGGAMKQQQLPPAEAGGERESCRRRGGRITEPLLSVRRSTCVIRFHSHHNPAGKLDYSHLFFSDEAQRS